MAWDFRVQSNWRSHPKFRKLLRMHGPEGVVAVFALWGYAAEYRQTGRLERMGREDICDAAEISTECAAIIDDLVKIGFLDLDEAGTYSVHNWAGRQPNLTGREERVAKKRRAANARWGKNVTTPPEKAGGEAEKDEQNQGRNAQCNAGAMQVQCPIPSHPIQTFSSQTADAALRLCEVLDDLIRERDPGRKKPNMERWAVDMRRIIERDGRTAEEVEEVMRLAHADAFWRGVVLSPRGLREKFTQLKLRLVPSGQDGQDVQPRGMSDAEFEARKAARKGAAA